jgi:hypothetical protein
MSYVAAGYYSPYGAQRLEGKPSLQWLARQKQMAHELGLNAPSPEEQARAAEQRAFHQQQLGLQEREVALRERQAAQERGLTPYQEEELRRQDETREAEEKRQQEEATLREKRYVQGTERRAEDIARRSLWREQDIARQEKTGRERLEQKNLQEVRAGITGAAKAGWKAILGRKPKYAKPPAEPTGLTGFQRDQANLAAGTIANDMNQQSRAQKAATLLKGVMSRDPEAIATMERLRELDPETYSQITRMF